jgi:hypothetical protein
MIAPHCLIEDHGRPYLLRDDFTARENGFTGPAPGPDAPAEIDRHNESLQRPDSPAGFRESCKVIWRAVVFQE